MTWNLVAFLAGLEAAMIVTDIKDPDGFAGRLLLTGLAAAIATVIINVTWRDEKKNRWPR